MAYNLMFEIVRAGRPDNEYRGDQKTGRVETYLQTIASINMGKMYGSEIEKVHQRIITSTRKISKFNFVFKYHSDGYTRMENDNYDDPLCLASVDECLVALGIDATGGEQHEPAKWALALLKSMQSQLKYYSILLYGE